MELTARNPRIGFQGTSGFYPLCCRRLDGHALLVLRDQQLRKLSFHAVLPSGNAEVCVPLHVMSLLSISLLWFRFCSARKRLAGESMLVVSSGVLIGLCVGLAPRKLGSQPRATVNLQLQTSLEPTLALVILWRAYTLHANVTRLSHVARTIKLFWILEGENARLSGPPARPAAFAESSGP